MATAKKTSKAKKAPAKKARRAKTAGNAPGGARSNAGSSAQRQAPAAVGTDELTRLEQEAADARAALQAKTRELEEAKTSHYRAKAGQAYDDAKKLISAFGSFLSGGQRSHLKRMLDESRSSGAGLASRTQGSAPKRDRKNPKNPPRFQVGDRAWTGKGVVPGEFKAWAESAEGKRWRKDNPDQKWPPLQPQSAAK